MAAARLQLVSADTEGDKSKVSSVYDNIKALCLT